MDFSQDALCVFGFCENSLLPITQRIAAVPTALHLLGVNRTQRSDLWLHFSQPPPLLILSETPLSTSSTTLFATFLMSVIAARGTAQESQNHFLDEGHSEFSLCLCLGYSSLTPAARRKCSTRLTAANWASVAVIDRIEGGRGLGTVPPDQGRVDLVESCGFTSKRRTRLTVGRAVIDVSLAQLRQSMPIKRGD